MLLSEFRKGARDSLTSMSRRTGIPVSTIFDKLKLYEKSFIKRHTSIIDFGKLGFDVRVQLLLKARDRDELKKFLLLHSAVNNFYEINNGYEFMVDAVFRNMGEYFTFNQEMDCLINKKNEFFVLQELKRESFLNDAELMCP